MKTRTGILILLSLTIFFSACEEETILPEQDPRDKFLGVWNVSEDCIRLNYDVNIIYDPSNSSQVLIENFANPGPGFEPAVGLVVSDKIFLDQQTIGDGWTVSGEGILMNAEMNWEYTLLIGGNQIECTAVYSR
jgi:hypothetical protein